MAYSKHTWTDNELITKDKMNNIENGISEIVIPGDATTSKKGVVKKATSVGIIETDNIATTTISGTAADDQLNAMVALVNEMKGKFNEVITKLKTAEVMEN